MKQFLVPAFFFIHAYDSDNAQRFAADLTAHINQHARGIWARPQILILDGVLPIKEVNIKVGNYLPQTYGDHIFDPNSLTSNGIPISFKS